tara:strand:+ start:36 stop:287 length:252 start_codon:yes stop_codon:yes gene_type:complete
VLAPQRLTHTSKSRANCTRKKKKNKSSKGVDFLIQISYVYDMETIYEQCPDCGEEDSLTYLECCACWKCDDCKERHDEKYHTN